MSQLLESSVKVQKLDGGVVVISFHRPQHRNAVDELTARALRSAFTDFDNDDKMHVAILHGEGGVFCAGADLKSVAGRSDSPPMDLSMYGPMGPTRFPYLKRPVIAAVEGYAVAGGLELALWCDMRVGDETTVFGVFCRRFGVPLIDGGTVRLPRLIGHSRAMDLILTGRAVDAKEALEIGLLNRLVPKGQVLSAAIELASSIAKFPQVCLRSDRQSAIEQWSMSLPDALSNEFKHGRSPITSGETMRGASKFADGAGRRGSKL